jgi:hypothetical protein
MRLLRPRYELDLAEARDQGTRDEGFLRFKSRHYREKWPTNRDLSGKCLSNENVTVNFRPLLVTALESADNPQRHDGHFAPHPPRYRRIDLK